MKPIKLSLVLIFFPLSLIAQSQPEWSNIDYQTKQVNDGVKINNLNNYSFFLHGEVHPVQSSPETKMGFLKYYYEEANVRNLVIEAGYGSAFLLNLYLKTGDESYICKDYNFFSHKEYRDFWRELYHFNNSVEEPIVVIGIDEFETRLVWFKVIEVLFSNRNYNDNNVNHQVIQQIITIIQSIKNLSDFDHVNRDHMDNLKKEFIASYKNNSDSYTEILQEDSLHLKFLILNEYSQNRSRHTNKYMYDNLHKLIEAKKVNDGNYFGQFGSAHVENHNRSLTRYLNDIEESFFYNRVLTVIPHYLNCNLSSLKLENNNLINIITPIKSRSRKKVPLHSNSIYILEELKNKNNKPNKYTLHIKNKDAMLFDFPEVCD